IVVAEGLLIYLDPEQVGALATDLHAQASFQEWLIDLASPQLIKRMSRTWGKNLAAAGAPFKFSPAESSDFFRPYGWRAGQYRAGRGEVQRPNGRMKGAWIWNLLGKLMPKKKQEEFRRFSGYVLLERG